MGSSHSPKMLGDITNKWEEKRKIGQNSSGIDQKRWTLFFLIRRTGQKKIDIKLELKSGYDKN